MKALFYLFILSLGLIASRPANAQIADQSWWPDFRLTDQQGHKHQLYQYLDQGTSVVLVFGQPASDACQDLLRSLCLQRLHERHGLHSTDALSSRELQVLFLQTGPAAQSPALPFPVIRLEDESTLFASDSWEPIRSQLRLYDAELCLITPDRLAHPMPLYADAADLYNQYQAYTSKLKPGRKPDLRLIACQAPPVAGSKLQLELWIQNFSLEPVQRAEISIWQGNELLATHTWSGHLEKLETGAALLDVSPRSDAPLRLTASVPGDCFLANNELLVAGWRHYAPANAQTLPVEATAMPPYWAGKPGSLFREAGHAAIQINYEALPPGRHDTLHIGHYRIPEQAFLQLEWARAVAGARLNLIASTDEGQSWIPVGGLQPADQSPISLQAVAGEENVWLALVATAAWMPDARISRISIYEEAPALVVIR